MYCLQTRWRLEGRYLLYYGLRNRENLFRNRYKLKKREALLLSSLPASLSDADKRLLRRFLGSAVVEESALKRTPQSPDDATFCKSCAANDYMIPGLEFDRDGRCPLCQTREETQDLRSILPIQNEFPRAKHSRFDVALFYTGGKDSTYLLYYLSRVLGLRVLAMTWEIPYMSESARRSIENAKRKLDTVEFITRYVAAEDLRRIYQRLYTYSGNTCACPSLAYILFYPELCSLRVPYFIAGNEPAQMRGLYYNHMAPAIAYRFAESRCFSALINIGRVLTLRPPLRRGQFHTLAVMRQLAYGDGLLKRLSGYQNELVSSVVRAIREVPSLLAPLRRAYRRSSRTGHIPAFVQVDLDAVAGGKYDWRAVRELITRECGWIAPEECDKGLHTSCKIEKCKEQSQFVRFWRMESQMIPFSALEIAIASRDGSLSREEAIAEIRESLGFSLHEVPECACMKEFFL